MRRSGRWTPVVLLIFIMGSLVFVLFVKNIAGSSLKSKTIPINNFDANFRRQQEIENRVRQQQWKMQNPSLPNDYNPHNYYVPIK